MVFVEYDHMVEQFATTTANEPFRNAILPRASEAGPFRLDTEALYCIDYIAVEIRGPIKDQVFGSTIVGKGFAQLLRRPWASRVLRGIEMKNHGSVMGDDEETGEHAESQRRNGEEVHGCDHLAMVAQKYSPSRGRLRIFGRFPHPAQYSSLGDVEAEHLEFALNSRCAPSRILRNDLEDELTNFLACRPSAHADSGPRNPLPVQLEPCTMPANDRIRLHQDQRLSPPGPEVTQHNPEKSVAIRDLGCGRLRAKTASCCRRARFSKSRSLRARKERRRTPNMSLRRRSMTALYHRKHNRVSPDGVLARDSVCSCVHSLFFAINKSGQKTGFWADDRHLS